MVCAIVRAPVSVPTPCAKLVYWLGDSNQGHLALFRMCHSQVEIYQLDLHMPMAYPPLIKGWDSQNLLMIDTTAALPVLHASRGMGKASMHELIIEQAQNRYIG